MNSTALRIKLLLLALVLSVSVAVNAGPSDSMPYHPYRKVGDKYFNLQPIYDWLEVLQLPGNKVTEKQRTTPRPMPEWIGEISSLTLPIDVNYKVEEVRKEGIVIAAESHAYKIGTRSYRTFLLLNYQFKDQIAVGQSVRFLALKTGVREVGSYGTIEVFDYGVPYNPWELARESAKTNTPAVKTNAPTVKSK